MDKADGAGTVLFDLKSRNWSSEVLDALGIDALWMPRTFEGTEFTGYVTEEAASLTGLNVGTPVVAGGGDQAAGAVGVGAVEPSVMLSAAGSLQWYRDTLALGMSFDDLLKEAETVPAGSDGLQFLPYLSGERTPYPDPLAREAFIGLTLRHGRGHMTRAVLEGVSFGLKDSFTLIQNAGLAVITQVRASGGGKF